MDATNWAAAAASVPASSSRPRVWVDHTASIGAVAQWNATTGMPYGHVAYVAGVLTNGNIVVEEYNYGIAGGYGQRTIAPASVDNFIHLHT